MKVCAFEVVDCPDCDSVRCESIGTSKKIGPQLVFEIGSHPHIPPSPDIRSSTECRDGSIVVPVPGGRGREWWEVDAADPCESFTVGVNLAISPPGIDHASECRIVAQIGSSVPDPGVG